MRTKFEKVFRIFMSLLMIIGLMDSRVFAASNKVSKSFISGMYYELTRGAHRAWGQGFTLKMDGDVAFCVDPSVAITDGPGYQQSEFAGDKGQKLSIIAYEGYVRHRNDKDSLQWRYATQILIWEEMGWTIQSHEGIDYSVYKKAINASVSKHFMIPSFDEADITLNIGEKTTLTDTNKVFHQFHKVSSDGLKVEQKGDKLSITATQEAKENSDVVYDKVPAKNVGTSLIYRKEGSQDIGKFFVKDPIQTKVSVRVNKTGTLRITKVDEDGSAVANTSFQLSYHSDMTNPIGTYTTSSDGSVEVPNLQAQTVYVKEVKVPTHLVLDDRIYSVNIKSNQTTGYCAVNSIVRGSVKLRKTDQDTGVQVGSAVYGIYDDHMVEVGRLSTRTDGWVESGPLRYGVYHIKEITAPQGYVLNPQVYDIRIQGNGEKIEVNGVDRAIKGYIKVVKKDATNDKTIVVADTVFDVYNADEEVIATIQTNRNGEVQSDLLRYGTYYLKEKTAPNGYRINDNRLRYVISEDGKTYVQTMKDERVKGSLTVQKQDEVTGTSPQGEATLAGAVYGLYARSDITDPADGSIIHKKGNRIVTLTMDKEASASVKDLYLGEYRLKEIQPSSGYTLDTRNYDFDLKYANQHVDVITKNVQVKERVIAQAFSIIKVSVNGSKEAELLQGAEFTIKARKDVEAKGFEAAPIAFNAKGKQAAVLVSDAQGYAVSDELPYGHYIVRETKVPANYAKTKDFEVVVNADNRTPQPWRVFQDEKFKAVIAIVKKDIETGKTIGLAGAKFKIFNLDKKAYAGSWVWNPLPHYVDSWTSDQSGQVMSDSVLEPGNYQLEEIEAPKGYTLNTAPVKFTIGSDVAYETLPDGITPVITIEKENRSVKGKIKVEKQGEQLDSVKKDEKGNQEFHYVKRGLTGAKFGIYAGSDIYAPDQSGKQLYKKDQLIEMITSGTNGYAESKEMPLGNYYVKEVLTPNGFAGNDTRYQTNLVYEGQMKALVSHTQRIENERVNVKIMVHKRDKDTGKDIEHAVFGLYAKQDILNFANRIVIKKGELIETAISDDKGLVTFMMDLPLAEYEIKELKAASGYRTNKDSIYVDARYKGKDVKNIVVEKDFKNEMTEVAVQKVDDEDQDGVKGAHLQIVDAKGSVIEEWITGSDGDTKGKMNPHMVRGLHVGEEYILQETKAPFGYTKAKDVAFIVKDQKDIQEIEMRNQPNWGILSFKKMGEVFQGYRKTSNEYGTYHEPYWSEESIANAEISVYAREDILRNDKIIYKKDEKIEVLRSKREGVKSKKLPAGKYYYVETKTPLGYITDTKQHEFIIPHDPINELRIVSSELHNHRFTMDLKLHKVLEEQKVFQNPEAYQDVVFGIYSGEDQIKDGKLVLAKDELVYIQGILANGELKEKADLPIGTYYVRELKSNAQYRLDEQSYPFTVSYENTVDGKMIVTLHKEGTLMNTLKRGSLEINKTDKKNGKPIAEVGFALSKDQDMKNIIATAVSDVHGVVHFDNLELGTYYLQEQTAATGYVQSVKVTQVKLKDDKETVKLKIVNAPVQMYVAKMDDKGKPLTGAKLAIYDSDGKIVTSWISKEQRHTVYYLEEGMKYSLREIEVPEGYKKSADIEFTAKNQKEIKMVDQKIEKVITGDFMNQNVWLISGMASVILGFLLLIKKKLS